jgi:hypothetical protein
LTAEFPAHASIRADEELGGGLEEVGRLHLEIVLAFLHVFEPGLVDGVLELLAGQRQVEEGGDGLDD